MKGNRRFWNLCLGFLAETMTDLEGLAAEVRSEAALWGSAPADAPRNPAAGRGNARGASRRHQPLFGRHGLKIISSHLPARGRRKAEVIDRITRPW